MPSEIITLDGHIINSLALSRTMDVILDKGGDFKIEEMIIGRDRRDSSHAQIKVIAPTQNALESILASVGKIGAVIKEIDEIKWKPAPKNGVFPDDFYSTTNLDTQVWYQGKWIPVEKIEMDCGIVFHPTKVRAFCTPVHKIKKGDKVIVGHEGIRVSPLLPTQQKEIFSFMGSSVSSEKPKQLLISELAQKLRKVKKQKGRILFVGGPAIIHTSAGSYLCRLIEKGYMQVLFAGNGFATHDIETNLFGTSLGISLKHGIAVHGGHRNHLRAINTIRNAGSIPQAVKKGILKSGVMYSCVKHKIPYVLSGSLRDDGPLPDVISDMVKAQDEMRKYCQDVDMALMVSSTLHAIATGNCLPARVYTVCVDINPAVVTKLADRGSAQTLGIVTDAESFLRELARAI